MHAEYIYLSLEDNITIRIYLHEFKNELAKIDLALSILRQEPGRLNDSTAYCLWGE